MKKILTFTLIALIALTLLVSCGGDSGQSSQTTTSAKTDSGDNIEETTHSYDYPDVNYNGEEFVILNAENIWGFLMQIDFEEMTGESLEDAIYTRNRSVEEKLNFKLVETTKHIDELANTLQKSILAGDNAYQAGFVGAHTISLLVGSNYLYDLYDIPELQLDEYWWDKSVINESKFADNSGLYFAATDLHLSAMDGTWCMMFNEDMAVNLNVDKPYDLVRQGKWTVDKLQEYAKLGANLNGDENFGWNVNGNSIYGYTSFDAASAALIFALGEKIIEKDANSQPYLAMDTERFFSVTERIARLNATEGEYFTANEEEPSAKSYGPIFKNERAFFIGCEIKMAQYLRDAEFTFGLVPFPKYNEEQAEYHSMMFYQLLLITIPITNGDTERAGNIIDALSFEAKQQVMPIYYDVYISQKGLRNEDSIEMLDLINQTRFFNIGNAYGWTTTLYNSIRQTLDKGSSDISALIAAQRTAIEANIEKTMSEIME